MNDSHIKVGNGGVAFVGPDAVDLYRVRAVKGAIMMHQKFGMVPTRGVTITKLFQIAKGYTGKTYKRGAHAEAIADLDRHIAAFEASMPVVRR